MKLNNSDCRLPVSHIEGADILIPTHNPFGPILNSSLYFLVNQEVLSRRDYPFDSALPLCTYTRSDLSHGDFISWADDLKLSCSEDYVSECWCRSTCLTYARSWLCLKIRKCISVVQNSRRMSTHMMLFHLISVYVVCLSIFAPNNQLL